MPNPDTATIFQVFNEIGIINQLSSRLVERHLPDGFLISHFTVLNHLVRMGDGRTPLSISTALQVPKTTLTHTLTGLRKGGFIVFAPNPRDSRSKSVMLTDAGRKFRDDAIARLGPDITKLEQSLDVAKLSKALPELVKLRQYLDAERDP